jgi:hypothetical protein
MTVLDDYMASPDVSFLDKTRIQAQVLVPVLRALREELGQRKIAPARFVGEVRVVQVRKCRPAFLANFRNLQATAASAQQ